MLLIKLRKIYKFFKNCSSRQYKKISSLHAAYVFLLKIIAAYFSLVITFYCNCVFFFKHFVELVYFLASEDSFDCLQRLLRRQIERFLSGFNVSSELSRMDDEIFVCETFTFKIRFVVTSQWTKQLSWRKKDFFSLLFIIQKLLSNVLVYVAEGNFLHHNLSECVCFLILLFYYSYNIQCLTLFLNFPFLFFLPAF